MQLAPSSPTRPARSHQHEAARRVLFSHSSAQAAVALIRAWTGSRATAPAWLFQPSAATVGSMNFDRLRTSSRPRCPTCRPAAAAIAADIGGALAPCTSKGTKAPNPSPPRQSLIRRTAQPRCGSCSSASKTWSRRCVPSHVSVFVFRQSFLLLLSTALLYCHLVPSLVDAHALPM